MWGVTEDFVFECRRQLSRHDMPYEGYIAIKVEGNFDNEQVKCIALFRIVNITSIDNAFGSDMFRCSKLL